MPQDAEVFGGVSPPCERSAPFEPSLPTDGTWNLTELRSCIEQDWRQALERHSLPPLTEMMSYALSGGKCLRGLLLLAVTDSCNGSRQPARQAAVALEMLHAASLVVDDLPALDDTPVRRGTLSLYKRFGEAAAILTAHALVAAAFEIVAKILSEPERLLRVMSLLSAAIGARGMARAELIGSCDSAQSGTDVRALKTGSLFQVAAHIGAVLAGAEPELAADLGRLGLRLGICYQVLDDVRDDLMDELHRDALREAGRRNWYLCADQFNLVRGRLYRARPMEIWLSRFQDAGADIVGAPTLGFKTTYSSQSIRADAGGEDPQP